MYELRIFPKKRNNLYKATIPQSLISQEHMTPFGILSIPSVSATGADMPHDINLTCQIPR